MRFNRLISTLALTFVAGTAIAAGPPAKVTDLAWMTGTWAVPFGPNTLEENWTTASNGNIASMVRMSGPNGVSMWEVITIEEKEGSLLMNIQQWNAGFVPRTPAAQKMELVEIGDIDPDHVHLPGISVDRIVVNANPEKRIEQRTIRQEGK